MNVKICGKNNNLCTPFTGAYVSITVEDGRKNARFSQTELSLFCGENKVYSRVERGENHYFLPLPDLIPETEYHLLVQAVITADGEEKTYGGKTTFRTKPDYATLPAKWVECSTPKEIISPAHAGYESETFDSAFACPSVTVDLGETVSAEYAVIQGSRSFDVPCQPDVPGIKFPIAFKIESANEEDFSDAVTIFESPNPAPNPGNQPVFYSLSSPLRYLRFTALKMQESAKGKFSFALEQIQVLNGLTNLAEGKKVIAETSIETEFLGRQKLTDGSPCWHTEGRAKPLPQPQFFRAFTVEKPVTHAHLYTAAMGLYLPKLNGKEVGNEFLRGEWTEFNVYANVSHHDVTDTLCLGENLLEIQAADGWYAGRIGMANVFGPRSLRGIYKEARPKIWAYLSVEYEDSEKQTVYSDESFLCTAEGAYLATDIYDGEVFDAEKEITLSTPAELSLLPLRNAVAFQTKTRPMTQVNEPIRVVRKLAEKNRYVGADGRLVIDFGENFAGVPSFTLDLPKGKVVRFIYSQHLRADGTCYVANMRGAHPIDTFRSAGKKQTYTPRFTYRGFRYVTVLGATSEEVPFAEGLFLSSDMETFGTFTFADQTITRFSACVENTLKSNLMGIQTDCCERDERLSWAMDGYNNSYYYFNSSLFFLRNMIERDLAPCPPGMRPDHTPTALNMFTGQSTLDAKQPLLYYRLTGQDTYLQKNYQLNARIMEEMHEKYPEGIVSTIGYADWLNSDMMDAPGIPESGAQISYEEFQTCQYYLQLKLMALTAQTLGKTQDAETYEKRATFVKKAFYKHLMTADKKTHSDTQTSYGMLLYRDMIDKKDIPTVLAHYRNAIARYNGRLSCGVYVIDEVLGALSKAGAHEDSLRLAFEPTFPSFGYMIAQGATSVWERWDSYCHLRPEVHEKLRWQAP
ncbi:MAG: family 78 glycoside hydrolase catalytic domain, partial [Clostridia bacterium]|nr:family 78 glycoside hydrolase catalytic domain [Clostridia bacterium]